MKMTKKRTNRTPISRFQPREAQKTALRSIIRYNFGPPRLYQMDRHAQMCTLVCNVSMATIDVIEKIFEKIFKKV